MITNDDRDLLLERINEFGEDIDTTFALPSRHTLSRYVTIYFSGFNQNLPFVHHTWRPVDGPIELLLAICAIGAQQCCEYRLSTRLFNIARDIQAARLHQNMDAIGPSTAALLNVGNRAEAMSARSVGTTDKTDTTRLDTDKVSSWHPVDAVRCTLLLLCYVTWCEDTKLVQQTYTLWNLLAHILTGIGLEEATHGTASTAPHFASAWEAAMREESIRRTKLSALSFLVTVSTTYDFPPSLRNASNCLRLPCSQSEWLAKDANQWQAARNLTHGQQLLYEEALTLMLSHDGTSLPFKPVPTAFGTYLLIHGLLHRIAIVRELNNALYSSSSALPVGDVEKLEYVLKGTQTLYITDMS